ncbi:4065_t:CDS:2 [Ambispora gerdemannii]|uniref:4065_t:CDS:1 n=1 Tax=Ambispora gerdemannii TaxID=144530 RepID=A0A9N9BV09_9GLOM|nr:4065_t:CDS:2 [Ambispora gerdemannii]
MVVDEISEILSFDQTNWLAPYITFNTEKCQKAKKTGNIFLSDFFKLKNNTVYSKTIEDVQKYQNVKLRKMNNERDEKAFLKKVRQPSFKYNRQFGDTLVRAHMKKASKKYGDKVRFSYMDTNSFIYHVETEDIYKDMAERPDLFNLNGDPTVGKFKDETPGNKGMNEMATDTYMPTLEGSLLDDPIDKSLLTDQEAKDLAMRTEADSMTLEVFHAKNVGIRSKDHVLSLVESEKKALCPIDTKRWILSDGITTLPYGHWRNMIYKNMVKDGISHE